MVESRLALITGATGGVGGEVAAALLRHGWTVRAMARDPVRAAQSGPKGVEWVAGDAMRPADIAAAARGAAVVFHGVNPPGYQNWRGLAIPMLRNAIDAAQAAGARLIYPSNVYVYGPDAGSTVPETAPQRPQTRKGQIRVEMEAMLHDAVSHGLRSLTVRAGDFFGPRAPSSWFTKVMLRDGAELRAIATPEVPGAGHAWAYLPDLAESIARLADQEERLPAEERLHFGGHYLTGRAMAEAVQRATGSALPVRPFRWLPVYLGAPFVTFLREVIEMRYLWRTTLRLDNARLVALIGPEPHTALDEAVRVSRGRAAERTCAQQRTSATTVRLRCTEAECFTSSINLIMPARVVHTCSMTDCEPKHLASNERQRAVPRAKNIAQSAAVTILEDEAS